MRGATAKQIRNGMYYPKKRKYYRKPNGQIIADEPRRIYQQVKKNVLAARRDGQTGGK